MSYGKIAQGIFGKVLQKVGETALHAAVFSYVSKKVSSMMGDDEKKEDKVRVEEPKTDSDPVPENK